MPLQFYWLIALWKETFNRSFRMRFMPYLYLVQYYTKWQLIETVTWKALESISELTHAGICICIHVFNCCEYNVFGTGNWVSTEEWNQQIATSVSMASSQINKGGITVNWTPFWFYAQTYISICLYNFTVT